MLREERIPINSHLDKMKKDVNGMYKEEFSEGN